MSFGIIGKVLGHSFSAEIHPKLFDCDYQKWELSPDMLDDFFEKRNFEGINVTIPYKTDVIKYLGFIDENAEKIGAVNTVVNKNGKLYGYNTDYYGLLELIKSKNVSLTGKNVLIFGSGATSKTARAVAENMGAKSVVRLSRKEKDGFDTYKNIKNYYENTDVIINTTPCGMYPNIYETAADIKNFKGLEAVFDVVYNPIRTKLVLDALNMGLIAEGGSRMLVFQAVYAARLFCGKDINDSKGEEILRDIIAEKQNIVLIGMPACGKTTVGKILAERLNKTFVDTDCEIEKKYKKTPKEIIESNGEAVFRKYESEIIKDISKNQNQVIATGGGAVLDGENTLYLKENGKIVYIKRDINELLSDEKRPLSNTKEKLENIYKIRKPLYEKAADIIINSLKTPEETANSILDVI